MNFVYFDIINLTIILKFNNLKLNFGENSITNKKTRIKNIYYYNNFNRYYNNFINFRLSIIVRNGKNKSVLIKKSSYN